MPRPSHSSHALANQAVADTLKRLGGVLEARYHQDLVERLAEMAEQAARQGELPGEIWQRMLRYADEAIMSVAGVWSTGTAQGAWAQLWNAAAAASPVSPTQVVRDDDPPAPLGLPLDFSTEVVYGWRAWRIVPYRLRSGDTVPRLTAMTARGGVWHPRERLRARCEVGVRSHHYESTADFHESPEPGCMCGVWATRELRDLRREFDGIGFECFGRVGLWGRVLEYQKGYRGQYAYPAQIVISPAVSPNWARSLESEYGVEVHVGREIDFPGRRDEIGGRSIGGRSLIAFSIPGASQALSSLVPTVTQAQIQMNQLTAQLAKQMTVAEMNMFMYGTAVAGGMTSTPVGGGGGGVTAVVIDETVVEATSLGDPALPPPKQRPPAPRQSKKPAKSPRPPQARNGR
ncbi:MAG TPA: hypothetical protein VG265_11960 [Gaiellaceae bacterium]|jgi:hypothetical protein|nr:hypothetical protein [Gaiellaceae bacterium]